MKLRYYITLQLVHKTYKHFVNDFPKLYIKIFLISFFKVTAPPTFSNELYRVFYSWTEVESIKISGRPTIKPIRVTIYFPSAHYPIF